MPSPQKISQVLIIDDHPLLREGLSFIINLEDDLEVVGQAENGREGLKIVQELKPDIILLDLQMPELEGLQFLETYSKEENGAPILILTTYSREEEIYQCMQYGVKGYLLKDSPRETTLEAIREILSGEEYFPANIMKKAVKRLSKADLTQREKEVLQNTKKGLSNKEIAIALKIAEGTVKLHLNSVYRKLKARGRTDAIRIAQEKGIIS